MQNYNFFWNKHQNLLKKCSKRVVLYRAITEKTHAETTHAFSVNQLRRL